jgi:hypothetical protein
MVDTRPSNESGIHSTRNIILARVTTTHTKAECRAAVCILISLRVRGLDLGESM